ncbi:MAG: sensor histidine kinase [Deltaproteobacteria bacterium]|nr:sensor histidine kinase [Deltaproteobacteria bacterium]MBW2072528.1 sensor histidine kinase [Deltaproteobacteria bacterium]
MDDMAHIFARVEEKKQDYVRYGFSRLQDSALKTFFDLAQEFDLLEDLYRVCVVVPKSYFSLSTGLYLFDRNRENMVLVCTSEKGFLGEPDKLAPAELQPRDESFLQDNSLYTPIRGKVVSASSDREMPEHELLGMLEIQPGNRLSEKEKFYFQKYANRIGYALSNKFLSQRNIEHLKFINALVADIEHNVIVPNMVYRLFLRRLEAKIKKNQELEGVLAELLAGATEVDQAKRQRVMAELEEVNRGLNEEFSNIDKHYRNISLFLESLFRKSHFQEGRFIPRTRRCNFKKEIIDPQLERFESRFQARGITIDSQPGGVPDEAIEAVVDVGLISQVFANLLSNALKYTRTVQDKDGKARKFITFGREILKDYFGPGKDGIKFNVFSSGPHISPEERERVFEEGYRGSDSGGEPGTGHGLSFVKKVVEIHGGVAGYEPQELGNNFYIILPK